MLHKFKASIFVQILLATLLPLILIFSLVLGIIASSVFSSSAGTAREKTNFFARQSAEQVRNSFLRVSACAELVAECLAFLTGEPSQTRAAARQIARRALENSPSAYRIRIFLESGNPSFGMEEPFGHIYYKDGATISGRALVPDEEPDADVISLWYDIPMKKGEAYHDSVAHGRFGPDNAKVYVASTNYPVIRGGKVAGCVSMGMLYRKSFQFVDKWEIDGSYRLLIVSEDGTILYASDDTLIDGDLDELGYDEAFLVNMKNAMQRNEPFMDESYSPVLGQKSLICVYPVELPTTTTRVFIYMDTPTQLVYREANASVRTVFLTYLAGLLLFIGSLFAATKNITNPIKRLTATADRIARGQLDAARNDFSYKHEVRHEVDSLKNSLDLMLKQMEESHNVKIAAMKAEYEKQKLQETSAAKDRFFANMSHEIRTPMNVILGMSEMMMMEDLTSEQMEYANHIKVSAESLLNIINDILDLSRLESGKLPLLPVHYDFMSLMENICSLGQYMAGKKGLAFNCGLTEIVPAVLYGDDGRLRQVLLNVIGNAVKFTEKGSVALRVKDEGEIISFEVTDTGIGIRPEDMEYLFEPFKQLDNEKNRHVEGTGLGLSICRKLLGLMGGAISVESEYGRGSTFRITIPKAPGDAGKIPQTSDALPTAFDHRARVLVVDDSESNLKVAREFLQRFGITADTAASGAQCLEMVEKTEYDLIFMDHMMPEMSGIEATERIRALGGRFAEVPIVALTANAVIGSRELLLSSGMNDFLAKPIERMKLQAILAKWMPGELALREVQPVSEARRGASEQAAHTEIELPDRLAEVAKLEELDVRLGLARVADNLELYEEMLGMIVEAIPAVLEKMDAAAQAEDTATLVNEAHKLKGALANLGAVRLSEIAKELELTGGNVPQYTRKLAVLRPALEAFAGMLQGLLPGNIDGEQSASPKEWRSFEDSLRDLRDALASFNYERSQEIISELARFTWGEERDKRLQTIRGHIRFFDYEAALNDLNRFFPKLR